MSKAVTKRVVRRAPAKPAGSAPSRPKPGAKVPLLFSFLRKHGGVVLLITLLVVFVHDVFGPKGVVAMRRSQAEVRKLQEEIAAIHEENRRAAEHVKALKTDPKLIERIAREQMGMTRPGERVYRISPKEETATAIR